ncbi:MAG TPA: L-histidine N(alpha)-methyltransferase [Desulfomonilaceae bacterium]|nr:L-histidine N(alpha)-methyltransferase [Desulfomonilaceae bacterium]
MNTGIAAEEKGLEIRNYFRETLNSQMASDVLEGMKADQKYIPSKYFYDARGSQLFELICRLPEYYLTRTEMFLLERFASVFTHGFENGDLVELGSGANRKIRLLLDSLNFRRRSTIRYVPVDVSEQAILRASDELVRLYPELSVMPLVADFTRDLHRIPSGRTRLILLFGSTIGNLDEIDTKKFLDSLANCLACGDRFLVGLDMIKPVELLEAAYNDSRGITEQFNKNVLLVLNAQLSSDFDPADFDHVAFYNSDKERVEMHVRARRKIDVIFDAMELTVSLREGETIRTEICRKFTRPGVERMVSNSGLAVSGWYSDPNEWFSIAEIVPVAQQISARHIHVT